MTYFEDPTSSSNNTSTHKSSTYKTTNPNLPPLGSTYRNNINKISSNDNYHKNPEYKYEYRTGSNNPYNYNYDISGYDENGDYFSGNIDISDNSGDGYIYDDSGNEIYIDIEWDGYGELEAYDEDGNYYEFTVD